MAYLENIRTFLRVYELGNMSAAARDLRISSAVASSRISQLEEYLNVRLFQRTTRALSPTEQGNLFYRGATKIIDAVEEAEAEISNLTQQPRGTLFIAAPIGIGQKFLAPLIPLFKQENPLIDIRLRLSDRKVDLAGEGLDASFFIGFPEDSSLKMRKIANIPKLTRHTHREPLGCELFIGQFDVGNSKCNLPVNITSRMPIWVLGLFEDNARLGGSV